MNKNDIPNIYNDNVAFETIINNTDDKNIIIKDNNIIFNNINFNKIKFYDEIAKYGNKLDQDISSYFEKSIKLTFKNCTFMHNLSFEGNINKTLVFYNCVFDNLIFKHRKKKELDYSVYFFISEPKSENFINKLSIHYCEFGKKFYINKQQINNYVGKINNIIIKESIFHQNFKLHNCDIKKIKLEGIDFEKNADFFKSKFNNLKEIIFHGINVKGITIFEECEFHNKLVIQYTTFCGLVQFRSAVLKNGLNIDKANIEKEVNFFGVQGLKTKTNNNQTSQETFRILKYHSEKVGNIIDANLYHSLELEEMKKSFNQIQFKKRDRLIFIINSISSEFGTNYIRPVWGIILTAILTILLLHFEQVINLSNWYHSIDMLNWRNLFTGIDKLFEYMFILNRDEVFQQHGFVFLLNKIMLGYFYYQFTIAVRKDTRK